MTRSCPNCGAQVNALMAIARVQACDYCGTTLVQADEVLTQAGSAGEMFDAPTLFTLGQTATIGARQFTPLGHLRYDYGNGWWDEYWGQDAQGDAVWVSVDEGDIVWQTALPRDAWPTTNVFAMGSTWQLGGQVFRATEVANATCIAFRGQLPEAPAIGETHLYVNLSGDQGDVLSGERWDGGAAWFMGRWIDPFEVGHR